MKGLSLVDHEEVPWSFGLRPGDGSSDTAGGAGNCVDLPSGAGITGRNRELAELQASISFPEIQHP